MTTRVRLPRIALNNPWVEYQVSLGTIETTAGFIYVPIEELAEANARAERLQAQLDEARITIDLYAKGIGAADTGNLARQFFSKHPALKEKA